MIEQGVRTPSLNIALAIAQLFDANPNEIFFNHSPNKNLGEINSDQEAI
jgi:putative transcriptional regulator